MATATTRPSNTGRAWRLFAVLLMLAFGFQSYLAQTHIHEPAVAASTTLIHHAGHKAPLSNSPFDCPFCQVVNHAGSVLLSHASLLLLASQWVELNAPRHLLPEVGAVVTHHWQSRAPPSP
jgi:hypothetical protein